MSITECLPEPNPAAALRKRVFVGFAGTLTVGLALAGWYVGTRILAAGNIQPAKPAIAKVAPPVLPAPASKMVDRPSETYLQLAAMGPIATEVYLKELAGKGIHPTIRPSPSENIYRILMGPYPDTSTLNQALRSLEAAGEKPMVRVY